MTKTGNKKRLALLYWLQKEMLEVLKIADRSLLWCEDKEGTLKKMQEIKEQMEKDQAEIKRLENE